MTQQNPFNSQTEVTLSESLGERNISVQEETRGLVPTVPGLALRNMIRRREGFSAFDAWRDIAAQQDPFSNQLAQTVVLFPRAQRVQANEEGVFVPKSLFGREAQVRFRQERRGDGGLQVVVYAVATQNRAMARRRAEVLDCSLELRWLDEHGAEYAGLWVALEGEQLLASGTNGHEVYETAIARGATRPFLVQVEPQDELPFGGW
jgi:hypothetical protein